MRRCEKEVGEGICERLVYMPRWKEAREGLVYCTCHEAKTKSHSPISSHARYITEKSHSKRRMHKREIILELERDEREPMSCMFLTDAVAICS